MAERGADLRQLGRAGVGHDRVAAERNLIASIACHPQHLPALREVAKRFPSVPFLMHHMAWVKSHDTDYVEGTAAR